MNVLGVISAVTTFQLLQLGVILLTWKQGNRVSNRILSVFMFSNALLVGWFAFGSLFDVNLPIDTLFYFLLAPYIYLYTKSLCHQNFERNTRELYHWVPGIIAFTAVGLDSNLTSWIQLMLDLQIAIYLYFTFKVICQYRKELRDHFSSVTKIDLTWLLIILGAFVTMWMVDVVNFIVNILGWMRDETSYTFSIISICINFLFATSIVYRGLKHPEVFAGYKEQIKYSGSGLTDEKTEEYAGVVEKIMVEKKPYLNPDLNIKGLADEVHIHPKSLSQVINSQFGKNFFDFVNQYRIDEARRLLSVSDRKTVLFPENGRLILSDYLLLNRITINHIHMKTTQLKLAIAISVAQILTLYTSVGQTINVPDDQETIQAAINSSQNGDTVLVAPGEYFENLRMNGKNIVLASWFVTTGDLDYINQTIINGSQPAHPDSASCLLIVSGENENCEVVGFTLTGGKGTRWEDEHNRGSWYTEGGGILIQYSSPTIRNNVIHDCEAILRNSRNTSSGGGAIRMGDSNPKILNNYLHHNKGRYGGGIVLNYSGAIIRNNLIVNNSGGEDFGGGGLWILANGTNPRILENNTIFNNSSTTSGGGIRIWDSSVILNNNIVWGNHAKSYKQIQGLGTAAYNNVEGGYTGADNIDENPRFDNALYILPDGSASIDAGNPHVSYNDPEDPDHVGQPLYPSKGSLRNDLGAYGGPGAQAFSEPDLSGVQLTTVTNQSIFHIYPNPVEDQLFIDLESNVSSPLRMQLFTVTGQCLLSREFPDGSQHNQLQVLDSGIHPGVYLVKVMTGRSFYTQRLVVR